MCGRYHITPELGGEVRRKFFSGAGKADGLAAMEDRDIQPTDAALVLVGGAGRRLYVERQRWGFVTGNGGGVVINARAETALDKPMFRGALEERRAVILASYFYEWNRNRDKLAFFDKTGGGLYLAGFYSRFEEGNRYVILTTAANESMVKTHERMPLILRAEDVEAWIFDRNRTEELLCSRPGPLAVQTDYEQLSLW